MHKEIIIESRKTNKVQWHIPRWDSFSTVFRIDFFWQKWECGENQRAQKKKHWRKIRTIIFSQARTVTNPTIWLVLGAVRIFLSLTRVTVTLAILELWKKLLSFEVDICLLYIYVIHWLRVGPYREKLWPQSWKCCPRPAALGTIFKTSVTVFHYTDLPAGK